MTFPVVESITQTSGDNSSASAIISFNYPATVNAGDLLLCLGAAMNTGSVGGTATPPAGYTNLDNGGMNASQQFGVCWAFYKIADGTEGGTSATLTTSFFAFGTAVQLYRISGWRGDASGISISAAPAVATASTADPPAVTASTGDDDNLFIVLVGMAADNGSVSTASTGYGNLTNTLSTSTTAGRQVSVGSFRRELAAASDDPGSCTLSTLEGTRANTIAIAPPPPLASGSADLTQFAAETAIEGRGVPSTSQFSAMVANVGPASITAQNSQLSAFLAQEGDNAPATSQFAAMVAYGTGQREDNTQRSWTFDQDGHTFYVLDLGTTGTYIYDLTTDQWAQWQTEGYTIWNAQRGTMWRDQIVAADFQTPSIYAIDPTQSLDEGFRPVRRVVTGLLLTRSRDFTSVDMLAVQASVGDAQTGFDGVAQMTLSFSDDQGQNYFTFGSVTLSSTDTEQELLYRSLGAFNRPGRVFRIEDLGGPVRISGADVDLT